MHTYAFSCKRPLLLGYRVASFALFIQQLLGSFFMNWLYVDRATV